MKENLMKSIFRFCLVLLIAVLVIAPTMTITRAQGTACLPGLQEADCTLLTAAGKGSISSVTMAYTLAVKVTGIEGVKSGSSTLHDISLNVAGNGPLSLDKSKLPAGLTPGDPSAAIAGVAALTLGNAIKIDLTNGPDAQSRSFEFRIIDSKVYWKSDNADMYPNSQKDQVGKWLVMPIDPSQMSSMPGFSNAMMGSAMMSGSGAAQAQAMMQQFMAVPGFITATRSDANDEATFTVNVSIATLLKSPQFKPILTALASSMGGGSSSPMDPAQLDAMLGMSTPYFENLKITATSVVGTKYQLAHGVGFHISLSLTAAQLQSLGALFGGSSSGSMPKLTNPLSADVNFMIKLSNLNQPITLTAPADAIPVDTGMSSGGSMTVEPTATSAQ
jgi:hypothetical protein